MKHWLPLLCAVCLVLPGCSSTRLTSSWTAKEHHSPQYSKILVLGLMTDPDRRIREEMETSLVNNLRNLGYEAVCACEEFGPKAFESISEQDALAMLNDNGFDAVLTVVLLDKKKERSYIPARVYYSPYSMYHNYFWGYYSTMYGRVYSPGYYVTDTRYFWESNFYILGDSPQLLYSSQSQSFDPSSSIKLSSEYGKIIVNDLIKEKVIAKNTVKEDKRAF
ncbi:MAG: hypothetical protein DI535_17925 [Citrobacter freundii]|nr:MAG: hypothetical protein DI535_17925 [Citrobacter freundii]